MENKLSVRIEYIADDWKTHDVHLLAFGVGQVGQLEGRTATALGMKLGQSGVLSWQPDGATEPDVIPEPASRDQTVRTWGFAGPHELIEVKVTPLPSPAPAPEPERGKPEVADEQWLLSVAERLQGADYDMRLRIAEECRVRAWLRQGSPTPEPDSEDTLSRAIDAVRMITDAVSVIGKHLQECADACSEAECCAQSEMRELGGRL